MTARKIRDDLVGVVHLPNGQVLKAGDEIPGDVEVGDHLFDKPADPDPTLVDPAAAPAGNASTEVWQEYARSKGASEQDIDGLSRDDLRTKYGN